MQEYVTLTIGKQKNIALIAHDNMKHELIAWVKENADILKRHFLYYQMMCLCSMHLVLCMCTNMYKIFLHPDLILGHLY